MISPVPKYYSHYGQWAIDDIYVSVVSKSLALICYKKYIINASNNEIKVGLNIIDVFKGITLEQKIYKKKQQLIEKLEIENKKYIDLKEFSRLLTKGKN